MKITFVVQNPESLTGASSPTQTFDKQGGSIGRAETNDWVLSDSSCQVSGNHGVITFEDGKFCYRDTSTNGTQINGTKSGLSWNGMVGLKDGDTMLMGPVQISVQISEGEDNPLPTPSGHQEDVQGLVTQNAASGDSQESILDGMPPFNEIETDYPIATETDDPVAALKADSEKLIGVTDPMEALGTGETPEEKEVRDFLASQKKKAKDTGAMPDLSGTTGDAFVNPQNTSAQNTNSQSAGTQNARPQNPHGMSDEGVYDYLESLEQKMTDPSSGSTPPSDISQEQVDLTAPLDHMALSPLGRGLGYDLSRHDRPAADQLLQEVGEALATAVEKLRDILVQSQSSGPISHRLSETKIHPHEDNPLRFSTSSQEAMEALFDRTNPIQLTAASAIAETLDQIQNHQAMTEKAVNAALEMVFLSLSPEFMRRRFAAYAGSRKEQIDLSPQWCWGMYEKYFEELKSERQSGLRKMFWQIFDRHYDELARASDMANDNFDFTQSRP